MSAFKNTFQIFTWVILVGSAPSYSQEASYTGPRIDVGDIRTSHVLGIASALGWTKDDLYDRLGKFEDANEFEGRRKKEKAIVDAISLGTAYKNSSLPIVNLTIDGLKLSDYDFERGEYRVCLPQRSSLTIEEDIPVFEDPFLWFSYGAGDQGVLSPTGRRSVPCIGAEPSGIKFLEQGVSIPMPDTAKAEKLYELAATAGGSVSMKYSCMLNGLEWSFNSSLLYCNAIEVSFSVGSAIFAEDNVFLRVYWDGQVDTYKTEFVPL